MAAVRPYFSMGSLDERRMTRGWNLSGYQIKEMFLGHKEHTSFEDYRDDVGKLSKMAEQVEFTIIKEAFNHGRTGAYKEVKI